MRTGHVLDEVWKLNMNFLLDEDEDDEDVNVMFNRKAWSWGKADPFLMAAPSIGKSQTL